MFALLLFFTYQPSNKVQKVIIKLTGAFKPILRRFKSQRVYKYNGIKSTISSTLIANYFLVAVSQIENGETPEEKNVISSTNVEMNNMFVSTVTHSCPKFSSFLLILLLILYHAK